MMHGLSGEQAYRQHVAAQQAQADRIGYTNGDEPRQILMGAVSSVVESQGNRICDLLGTVSLFLDRFFGPQPEPGQTNGVPTPQSSGIIHEVERNLERNDYLLGELEQKIRRLGDIA